MSEIVQYTLVAGDRFEAYINGMGYCIRTILSFGSDFSGSSGYENPKRVNFRYKKEISYVNPEDIYRIRYGKKWVRLIRVNTQIQPDNTIMVEFYL